MRVIDPVTGSIGEVLRDAKLGVATPPAAGYVRVLVKVLKTARWHHAGDYVIWDVPEKGVR